MGKFKKWFDNYWYHYKWQTIIAAVFIVVISIGIGQIAFEKNDYDVFCLYAGSEYIDGESHDKIVNVLKSAAETVGEEDENDVNLQALVYLSEERIAELTEKYRQEGEVFTYDVLENSRVFSTFMQQLVSGENVIMFLDPVLYNTAEENEALYSIKDILGKDIPGMTESGYGAVLGECGLLEKYPELGVLPDKTVICFKKVTHAMKLTGKKVSQKKHEFQLDTGREMFRGIGE